jgi:hypothetical protein
MDIPDLALMQASLVGPPAPDIVALEARIRAAQLDGDVAALDALIAEDLLFTGPDGRLGTKAEDLAAHRAGAVRVRSHEPEELRVRWIGAAAAGERPPRSADRGGRRRRDPRDVPVHARLGPGARRHLARGGWARERGAPGRPVGRRGACALTSRRS